MYEAGVEEFDPFSRVTSWKEFHKMRDYYSNLADRYDGVTMMHKELPPEYGSMQNELLRWVQRNGPPRH